MSLSQQCSLMKTGVQCRCVHACYMHSPIERLEECEVKSINSKQLSFPYSLTFFFRPMSDQKSHTQRATLTGMYLFLLVLQSDPTLPS